MSFEEIPPPPSTPTDKDAIERTRSIVTTRDLIERNRSLLIPSNSDLIERNRSLVVEFMTEQEAQQQEEAALSKLSFPMQYSTSNEEEREEATGQRSEEHQPSFRERIQMRLLHKPNSTSNNKRQQQPVKSNTDIIMSKYNDNQELPTVETLFEDSTSSSSSLSSGICRDAEEEATKESKQTPKKSHSPSIPFFKAKFKPIIAAQKASGDSSPRRSGIHFPNVLRLSQHFHKHNAQPKPMTRIPAVISQPKRRYNVVKLHIYDLLASETYMQLPWGCHFPIGKCFATLNDGLHALGTGAYHCGVEVNGIEYAFGANDIEGASGVFTCIPKHSPGYEYRTTLDFGKLETKKRSWIKVPKVELSPEVGKKNNKAGAVDISSSFVYREQVTFLLGHTIMREMAREYKGDTYDLLRRNCCTFAKDACLRLGVDQSKIPTWFLNLADAGATTKDMAASSLRPLSQMLSFNESRTPRTKQSRARSCPSPIDRGFEVICQEKKARKRGTVATEMEIVQVVESVPAHVRHYDSWAVRRTLSWAY